MPLDQFAYEKNLRSQGIIRIAGIDEVGRGPLAGPVVAAAVILPVEWVEAGMPQALLGLNDSKQLSASRRDRYRDALLAHPGVQHALGIVEPAEIDTLNILRATHRAMATALAGLASTPEHILVDGLPVPGLAVTQTALVKGDGLSYSIAAASVIAKVTRDRLMDELDGRFPGYGFARHKGYGTPEHLQSLRTLGPCPAHRRSFDPLHSEQLSLFG